MAVDLKKLKNVHVLLMLKAFYFVNLWYKKKIN